MINITPLKLPVSFKFDNLTYDSNADFYFYCFKIIGQNALLVACLTRSPTRSAYFVGRPHTTYTLSATNDLHEFFAADKLKIIIVENITPKELLNYIQTITPTAKVFK